MKKRTCHFFENANKKENTQKLRGQEKPGKNNEKNLTKPCEVDEKLGGVALFSEKRAKSPANPLFFCNGS
jgi:hypothetical protein